ncbi:hypothetical protein [Bacillus sp. REN3]|uniref:hypothetical protein n=1 Tax=Bacillus sp. REN3 TaxID=2802440 RepID=UPI001AEE06A1|nr:hypothetical protein [Bacillus sp. REN3]
MNKRAMPPAARILAVFLLAGICQSTSFRLPPAAIMRLPAEGNPQMNLLPFSQPVTHTAAPAKVPRKLWANQPKFCSAIKAFKKARCLYWEIKSEDMVAEEGMNPSSYSKLSFPSVCYREK